MSQETMQWLNTRTLIGHTDKRDKAWHYKQELQGDEPNHYPGAIPVADVERRLFSWEAVAGQVTGTALMPDGVLSITDDTLQAIMRPPGALGPDDKGGILYVGAEGYKMHQYRAWLLTTVADILDDSLSIGSAGLLQMGGMAWVSVEVPDNIVTPSGVVFRPHLLAATSLNGKLSTTYKRTVTNVVCDNTMAIGLANAGGQIKIRHTRNSDIKLQDARAMLELVHTIGDEFQEQVEQLTNTAVSAGDWARFLDTLPLTSPADDKGKLREGRSATMAANARQKVSNLWDYDDRVAPWAGTAYGVVQAINTYSHHLQGTTGKTGPEVAQRNMLRAVTGATDKSDRETMKILQEVLAPA